MEKTSDFEGDRIAKVLARAGICSRRDAERMIADGRVAVNGRRLDTPALNVKPSDHITVDGKPVGEPDPPRLWRYHKPAGLVTTNRDPQGRDTVFQKLPASLPRVNAVGRLDINTEGLLLLTNDGGMKRFLELPSTGWLRRYRVRAFGKADEARLAALKKGIEIDGVQYRSIDAHLERVQGGNVWLTMALREGKNREIKKVLEALDLKVNRLIRLSFGPFQLGQLESGTVEEVPRRVLRQQLGKNWQAITEGTIPKGDGPKGDGPRNDAPMDDGPKNSRKDSRKDSRKNSRKDNDRKRGKPGDIKSRDTKPRDAKPRDAKPTDAKRRSDKPRSQKPRAHKLRGKGTHASDKR